MFAKSTLRPPARDCETVAACRPAPEAGHVHYLLGAGAAAYAMIVPGLASLSPLPPSPSVQMLVFALGMLGGWFIRRAHERRWAAAVERDAWAVYHRRRQREFGLA